MRSWEVDLRQRASLKSMANTGKQICVFPCDQSGKSLGTICIPDCQISALQDWQDPDLSHAVCCQPSVTRAEWGSWEGESNMLVQPPSVSMIDKQNYLLFQKLEGYLKTCRRLASMLRSGGHCGYRRHIQTRAHSSHCRAIWLGCRGSSVQHCLCTSFHP